MLRIAEDESFESAQVQNLGNVYVNNTYNRKHIDDVLALPLVDKEAIAKADFTVAVDAVNSVGGVVIPMLLKALGVKNIIELNCEPTVNSHILPSLYPKTLLILQLL